MTFYRAASLVAMVWTGCVLWALSVAVVVPSWRPPLAKFVLASAVYNLLTLPLTRRNPPDGILLLLVVVLGWPVFLGSFILKQLLNVWGGK